MTMTITMGRSTGMRAGRFELELEFPRSGVSVSAVVGGSSQYILLVHIRNHRRRGV